jgi:hypothetical protein
MTPLVAGSAGGVPGGKYGLRQIFHGILATAASSGEEAIDEIRE